ncbi:indole-3-glycerol phosphate synthase TrpC [Falsibacillus pallidus]|uniref:Indole-3-glycerol phosphate synthase n=1 Tax=Falsibacillus pallidus TaxID=493781 RepID=A0A370GIF9_9BACI|nr:indole-3-glycerol phosphate synthase TrpC [Falsibacillus pallidus]RDI43150.1 indole-3-glycerol phosphate synthase [Falsibacillus pallidus]
MTILEKIITEKRKEVVRLKTEKFPEILDRKPVKSMYDSFMSSTKMNVIAEIKRASPSKGEINSEMDPVMQAVQYEEAGADAISVLTDAPFFSGSMEDLRRVREHVSLPILCKDFIIDPIQIHIAKASGADVILLIVAALEEHQLRELYSEALDQGLEVLVEVHNAEELQTAMRLGANIIGINNRDLKTFIVDLAATEELAGEIRGKDILIISESGMKSSLDSIRAEKAGAKGILVGETLMRSGDIALSMKNLKVSFDGVDAR